MHNHSIIIILFHHVDFDIQQAPKIRKEAAIGRFLLGSERAENSAFTECPLDYVPHNIR